MFRNGERINISAEHNCLSRLFAPDDADTARHSGESLHFNANSLQGFFDVRRRSQFVTAQFRMTMEITAFLDDIVLQGKGIFFQFIHKSAFLSQYIQCKTGINSSPARKDRIINTERIAVKWGLIGVCTRSQIGDYAGNFIHDKSKVF